MLSKRYGVCGNPITGYPDLVYSRTVKLGWLRALVLDMSTWEAMLQQVPASTNVAAVITGQSGPLANDFWSDGWRGRYRDFVTEFCERFYKKVRLIEFVNEWDFWDNEDKAEKAAELAMIGTQICKEYGILGVLGSVASADWKNQLARAIKVIDKADKKLGYSTVHGFAFHPYVSYVQRDSELPQERFIVPTKGGMQPADGWERLSDKIREAIGIAGGRACAVTEVGIKVGDAGGEPQQAKYVHGVFQDELERLSVDELLMATYFCWVDQNGAPSERGTEAFGLLSEDTQLRPAYHAATYQFQMAPVVDIPIARLLAASKAPVPVENPQPAIPGGSTDPGGSGTQGAPTVPQNRVLTPDDAHQIRWQAIVPHAPYNASFGFERAWRNKDNAWWGSPITENEYLLDDGRPVRIFTNAVIAYNGADDTTEVL